jgi:hypothetical protein
MLSTRAIGLYGVVALSLVAACSREQLGLPRTPVSAISPDGRLVAEVRNHPNLDPPSQTIWLGRAGGTLAKVKTLGPDSDWCNAIVWSSDSSTVSYLVQDARLITVDAASARILSEKWLTDWRGEYPPKRMVRKLALSGNGLEASFEDCLRQMRPGYVHDAVNCGSVRTMSIR